MSRSKTVLLVILTVLLCLSLELGASDEGQPSRGLTGVQEFFTSGTFTVPKHVTHVIVTTWGAGGGGGAAALPPPFCYEGSTGGGGAYTNTVVPVIPGETYNVVVGIGGAGGENQGGNGGAGGDSQFALGEKVLAFAGGGKGGGAAPPYGNGLAGAGGQADPTAQISHSATTTYLDRPPSRYPKLSALRLQFASKPPE